jgi:hypothetical protein
METSLDEPASDWKVALASQLSEMDSGGLRAIAAVGALAAQGLGLPWPVAFSAWAYLVLYFAIASLAAARKVMAQWEALSDAWATREARRAARRQELVLRDESSAAGGKRFGPDVGFRQIPENCDRPPSDDAPAAKRQQRAPLAR